MQGVVHHESMPTQDRAARKAIATGTCHLCGHDGADQADHILPLSLYPELDGVLSNYAPAHGVKGCPTCGEKCNQVKGNGTVTRPRASRSW